MGKGLETGDLKGLLRPDQISLNPQDLVKYGNDWLKLWKGRAGLVLFPEKTQEIAQIVNWARKHKYKLIPSGGRTGLSGGAVAIQEEVVVSFDRMDQILDFDPFEQTVCVSAGCVTQKLKEFVESRGLYFPVSFASQGSSQIGGNVATNAGGAHVLRYGTMRNQVLGLEVVTGRGEILSLGRGLVKNATGYNLKDLFIGSEGTLGFVTKAVLSLASRPDKPQVFLISLSQWADLPALFKSFKSKIQPLAFEFWTNLALDYVLSHSEINFPLSKRKPFYALIEIEGRDRDKSLAVFEEAFKKGLAQDGVLSESLSQSQSLWALRENISEAISSRRPYKNDISVRLSKMAPFLKELEGLLQKHYPTFENVVFGHLGDGNLHINILKPKKWDSKDFIKECQRLNVILFELVKKYQGSISAEHGVGLLKKPYLHYSLSPEELALMKAIKKIFDPDNILNSGKIFDL